MSRHTDSPYVVPAIVGNRHQAIVIGPSPYRIITHDEARKLVRDILDIIDPDRAEPLTTT